MSCLRLEQVYLYLEGELDPAERRLVERHLDLCPGCRRAVEERRILHEASLTLPPLEVPRGFRERVLDRIPARSASSFVRSAVLVSAAGAFGLTLLGVVLVMGLRLPAFLVFLTRSFWNFLGRAGAILGKLLQVLFAGLKVAGEFAGSVGKVLETLLASFLPAGTAAPALLLGLVLTFLLILGMRRFLVSGEKP
jgi:anti-sigma factor RsiW